VMLCVRSVTKERECVRSMTVCEVRDWDANVLLMCCCEVRDWDALTHRHIFRYTHKYASLVPPPPLSLSHTQTRGVQGPYDVHFRTSFCTLLQRLVDPEREKKQIPRKKKLF